MKTDPRIDAYIARKADFARPILEHLRSVVHAACPECEETMKWSSPTFMYRGEMLAGMAAFKAHAAFGFWKGGLVVGEGAEQLSAMGQFGRLTSLEDLPRREVLEALIKKAMKLTEEGVKTVRNKHPKAPFAVPDDLRAAMAANKAAAATFESFPPSSQRDYVEWITESKREETRIKRVAQAVEWLAEGKRRNWKYENC
ncbi:MAG TPA: YdeI/OmpD-associated family protein [Allosphingosinicella sp.]|nr:YdeI/OmpD-associated family protein [Allosphingosinicella sp.]